jgi:hypothetical protein
VSETASATIGATQLEPAEWQYTTALDDTGSTPVGTFWFAWVPGEDFLDTRPANVTSPAGWTGTVTNAGSTDGYGIRWEASSSSADLQPNGTPSFSFTSGDAPAAVFGNSAFYPTMQVLNALVYTGAPFAGGDPGFNLVLTKCLRAGTRILTQRGEVPVHGDVEALLAAGLIERRGTALATEWDGSNADIDVPVPA